MLDCMFAASEAALCARGSAARAPASPAGHASTASVSAATEAPSLPCVPAMGTPRRQTGMPEASSGGWTDAVWARSSTSRNAAIKSEAQDAPLGATDPDGLPDGGTVAVRLLVRAYTAGLLVGTAAAGVRATSVEAVELQGRPDEKAVVVSGYPPAVKQEIVSILGAS